MHYKKRISFVLYVSMRVQSERVTREEFAEELAMTDNEFQEHHEPSAGDYSLLLDADIISDHDPESGGGAGTGDEVVEIQGAEIVETGTGLEAEMETPALVTQGGEGEGVG